MALPMNVHSLIDALSESLRERILTEDLRGGTQLTEGQVARAYQVARPTARAAIERLLHQGLLRRGARSPKVSPQRPAKPSPTICTALAPR